MPKKPKGGRRNINWTKIKADYVSDPGSSLKKMAEKYDVSLRSVANKSKADNWFATKLEHQEQLCIEASSKLTSKKAESLAQELDAVINLSDRLINVLTNDPDQFNRHILQLETPVEVGKSKKIGVLKEPIEKIYDKLDTRAIKDVAQSLKILEDMKRSIMGIERLENMQKHQLDQQRMQLEREKFEFEKQKAEFGKTDNNYAIRIEGFEEGWDE